MTVGKWLVVLPLLVDFNAVTLLPTRREARQLDLRSCCPCSDSTEITSDARAHDRLSDTFSPLCPGHPQTDDAETAASLLLPALRAMQPSVKQPNQKNEPKPLLQPEVGLASSVLETLRQATDEEYQEALARDATRSTVKLLESNLDTLDDTLIESPKNKVRIFLKVKDDMDDNLPEPSHIQETRCVHSPLKSQLKTSRPKALIDVIELSPKSTRKLSNKRVLHRKFPDKDSEIGASNIKENIMQPNIDNNNSKRVHSKSSPGLLSLFRDNNLKESEGQKEKEKNVSDLFNKNKPNIHLNFRELIDNLEIISKKEKSQVPVIDLKKYMSPTTQTPSLKFNPIGKLTYNNRPLFMKDLSKLKDVELIPPSFLTKSSTTEKPSYPYLKLQSEISVTNPDIDNCGNFVPELNKDINKPIHPNMADAETSPTNSNYMFESKSNHINGNIKDFFTPFEGMTSSENNDEGSISSLLINLDGQDNFDYSEIKLEEDSNKEQLLPDNCDEATGNIFMEQLLNNGSQKNGLNNNSMRKGQMQKLNNNEDILHDESKVEPFQLEFLEDFDTPIEFDNSSFNPKSNLKIFDSIQNTVTNNENILNDSIPKTNEYNFQIEDQNNESPNMSLEDGENTVFECDSKETNLKNSNIASEQKSYLDKNSMQEVSSEDDTKLTINSAIDRLSDINEDPSEISFKDLQDMSNSILSLSECGPLTEENENAKSNFHESLDQINDNSIMPNRALAAPMIEINSKETETENISDIISSLNSNNKLNEISDINSSEKLCRSTIFDDSLSNITEADIRKPIHSNVAKNEMRAEASELQSMSYDQINPQIRKTVEGEKHSNIFAKPTAGSNDISEVDKHSIFFNNLKSKLAGLFTATERMSDSSDDNVNANSDINHIVAKFGQFKNLDNLQQMTQTLIPKISLPEIPDISLNSIKNKLPLPKHADQSLPSNLPNLLIFPRPFEDISDPSLTFTALSDKLRSHTENTLQNVKETLESTLKDSENFRLSGPTDTTDTYDVLESITNRRNEMKEKLEAIHLDLNDRFSSFQQSILDHFRVPTDKNFIFKKDSDNGGLRESHISTRQELNLPKESKLPKVKHDYNLLPQRLRIPKNGKHTEINIASPKVAIVSDATRFDNSNRKMQTSELYSTTTPIPSFIPRPKILKTNIISTPTLIRETLSKPRPSEKSFSEQKVTNIKPLSSSLKPERTSNLSDEPYSLSSSTSMINLPAKSFKTNTEKISRDKSRVSTHSPVDSFRETFQNNLNQKIRKHFRKSHQDLGTSNVLATEDQSNTGQGSLFNLGQEGRTKSSSRYNDGMIVSPTTQNESELRIVEPMEENVPYKCKLICYKDS